MSFFFIKLKEKKLVLTFNKTILNNCLQIIEYINYCLIL